MPPHAVCVHCSHDLQSVLLCEACHRVQPFPDDADAFAILGLPRRLAVDPDALEERFHALSRHLHPDRFHGAPELEQARSLTAASALNRAYRALRDPQTRARYWLGLGGVALGDEQKTVPPDLAEAAFELQEIIEEARQAALPADRAAARGRLRAMRGELKEQVAEHAARIEKIFAEAGDAGPEDSALRTRLQQALSAYNYVGRQLLNVEVVLEL